MADNAKHTTSTVIPALLYDDAPAAIEWLFEAFGFEPVLVVPGEDENTIAHAQLSFGNGMVMLGSTREDEYGRMVRTPRDLGDMSTSAICVIVEDADQHYERAVAAGAEVVMDIEDQDYGGRSYMCRDPEGHLWSFGTYDPWEDE